MKDLGKIGATVALELLTVNPWDYPTVIAINLSGPDIDQ